MVLFDYKNGQKQYLLSFFSISFESVCINIYLTQSINCRSTLFNNSESTEKPAA